MKHTQRAPQPADAPLPAPQAPAREAQGGPLPPRQHRQQAQIQRLRAGPSADAGATQKAARHGLSGSSGPLPHLDRIQASFGRHEVGGVQAHLGRQASEGAQAMGAEAFASGNQVAFSRAPSLHTAAHEAAHVVQQRAGVQLAGGVGRPGDRYERHADAVADAVVAGQSSEALLDRMAGTGPTAAPARPTGLQGLTLPAHGADSPPQTVCAIQMDLVYELSTQVLKSYFSLHALTPLLGFADARALEALQSYSGFKRVYDTVSSFSNALSLALNLWDSIPSPIRTGILYLTGRLMNALPWVDALSYAEGYIVDADKDASSTYLVKAVQGLKLALKAASSPVSSAFQFGKYLYGSWWSGSDGGSSSDTAGQTVKPSARRGDLASLNLHVIRLDVKQLHLEKSSPEAEGETAKEGGLHADFAFFVKMFGKEYSLGERQELTLILPWSGGAMLVCRGAVQIIDQLDVSGLFEIQGLAMTELVVSNHGLQTLRMALAKFGIASDAITMSGVTAEYQAGAGASFNGQMGLNLFDWRATADLELALDAAGDFQVGRVRNFKESRGLLTVEEATISASDGFAIRNAALDLASSTGLDLRATLEELRVKQGSVQGKASLLAKDLPLLGDKVMLSQVKGEALYKSRDSWALSASAGLKMDFSHVQASGEFSIAYQSGSEAPELTLSQGQLLADYDAVRVSAKDFGYDHGSRSFHLAKATVDIKAIQTQAEVEDVTVNKDGLNFKKASIAHSQPITPFPGLSLSNSLLQLEKDADDYKLTASADLDVDIGSPKVKGRAQQVQLSLDKQGLQGQVQALKLSTTPFDLALENARLGRDGLSVDSARISFSQGDKSSDDEAGRMIPSLKPGLLDFIPIGGVAFTVTGVKVDSSGVHIESFKPEIPPIRFSAFGIGGELDLENMRGQLEAAYELSLAKMAPGLPLSASVMFPVFPGLEVYGSLAADANMGLGFKLNAGAQDGHWALGGKLTVNGGVSLTVELGAQLGSQAIVALSAGAFARGEARIANASAGIEGKTRYDRRDRKFVVVEPLNVSYDLNAAAIASVGIAIKAKAFYFFERKIYEYTAAQWTLGTYQLKGRLGDEDGTLKPATPDKLGLSKDRADPPPTQALEGQAAEAVLRSDTSVANSGAARLALLKSDAEEASRQLRTLHERGQRVRQALADLERRYIQTIQKKEQLFTAMAQTMDAESVNHQLDLFNARHGVEALQQTYAQQVQKLEQVQVRLEQALQALDKLASAEAGQLEDGMQERLKTLEDTREGAASQTVPDSAPLAEQVTALDKSVDQEVLHQKITLSSLNEVMSLQDFISRTTTSGFFGVNKRKTIQAVDNALQGYHQSKSRQTLTLLAQAIEDYLSQSSSQRVPYVLLLQQQARKALEALG